jgi:zinc transport system substrate-binding protein
MITRIVLILAVAVCVSSCGGDDNGGGESSEREVVAAFYPLAFAAERIAAEDTSVRNLTPAGTEPHDLELSPRDVETVRAADFVLYVGSGFQPALEEAVDGASGETIDVLEGLELVPAVEAEHGHEEEEPTGHEEEAEGEARDPHVWLDPVRFARVVERIALALDLPEAAAGLTFDLRDLDREFADGLRNCKRREIVTSHAAFTYLARRYDLRQIPISGVSPEAEPTAQDLEEVVHEVEESGATTVFFETLVSPRLAETIARETRAKTAVLDPLEGLTQDELNDGENYFTVMRANLDALRRSLGCT